MLKQKFTHLLFSRFGPGNKTKLMQRSAVIVATAIIGAVAFMSFTPAQAAIGTNEQINYQGRLLTGTGAVVADGSYNMEFKVTQDGNGCNPTSGTFPCAGTVKWTETREAGNKVLVKNGYFSVYLGSVTAFGASVDWNQDTLWLSINIGGTGTPTYDGAMKPLTRLSSTPYALNSKQLGGLTASQFVQLSPSGVQTGNINVSGTVTSGAINGQTISSASIFGNTVAIQGSNSLTLGVTGTASGATLFKGATAASGTITMQSPSNPGTYSLTLPSALGASGDCLKDTNGTGVLGFSYCVGSALTLQNAYDTTNGNTIVGTTGRNISITLADLVTDQTLEITQAGTVNAFRVNDDGTFSDTTPFVIDASGNIGIGVAVPGYKLDIAGGDVNVAGHMAVGDNTGGPGAGVALIVNEVFDSTNNCSVGCYGIFSKSKLDNPTVPALGVGINALVETANTAFTLTNAYAIQVQAPAKGAASTITNALGIFVAAQTIATNNAGIMISEATGTNQANLVIGQATIPTGTYSIYNISADQNYFAGNTGIGNTSPASLLTVGNMFEADNSAIVQLIQNNSMETNSSGWVAKGTGTLSLIDASAQFGSRALQIVTGTVANNGGGYLVPLKASTQYSLSLWARRDTGSAAAFNIGYQENSIDVDCLTNQTLTTTWTQFTCSFTTGVTVDATTNVYIKQSDTVTDTIYVDGVSLVQAASALTFTAGGNNLDIQSLNSNVTINNTNSGELQAWQLNTNALAIGRRHASTATSNGYIYQIGGCTGACSAGLALATVFYSKIASDGSVGAWTATTSMPVALYGQTSFVANGYVYVIGGDTGAGVFGATPQSTVYYAKLNNDGTVGAWLTNANALTAAREFHTSITINGFAYVIGGDNAGAQSTSYYGKLNADGSISVWATTTALTTGAAARRYASSVFVNGYLYVIGGDSAGTAQSTVYYIDVNANGSLGATWATTSALPAARRYHTSVVSNGYIYTIGGDNAGAQGSVYYAKTLNTTGGVGTWQTNSNAFPSARYGHSSLVINGYVYVIGGTTNGTSAQPAVYYASTPRVLIGGSLDLVGLSGQSLSDYGGGGSIVAGDITAVGRLRVEGFADINGGLSVDSALNINAVSADVGQNIFNINNLNTNSIFSIKHMSTNFGSLATAGAFMSKNSYFGEEFNVGHLTNCLTPSTAGNGINNYARGDYGNAATATACTAAGASIAGGELSMSHVLGAAAGSCTAASQNVVNGVERLTATSTVTAASTANCVENITFNATTSNKIFAAANLPVVGMKVKAQTLLTASNNARINVGLVSSDSANTLGVNSPTNSIYFTNCSTWTSAGSPTGCSNTTWYGISSGATTATVVTCSTGSGSLTAQFSYLRIEVRSTTDIRFFADYNSADGINETECGSGVTATASASAMTAWMQAMFITATANTTVLDIDYFRVWQDDNIPSEATTPDNQTVVTAPNGEPLITVPPLSPESVDSAVGSGFFSFDAVRSEDTVFEHDVYVKGTLYVDKIRANQIEGLVILTDKIMKLEQQTVLPSKKDEETGTTSETNGSSIDLSNMSVQSLRVGLDLEVQGKLFAGGLEIIGQADFMAVVNFHKLVSFNDRALFNQDVQFLGRTSFNNDSGGFATIKKDHQQVEIKFAREYATKPVVNTTVTDGQFITFTVKDVTEKGFTIILKDLAGQDINFSWTAFAIDNAQTVVSQLPAGLTL